MKIDKLILTGIMAGVYYGILDGFEQGYGINYKLYCQCNYLNVFNDYNWIPFT
ncbi:hypothetical protein [Peribacillus loiseleuriae]|uniref:hypothetical protein n=1 Tax=Peribacillus loiseleuriae TaxID=1679170 RepID=UPI003D05AD65